MSCLFVQLVEESRHMLLAGASRCFTASRRETCAGYSVPKLEKTRMIRCCMTTAGAYIITLFHGKIPVDRAEVQWENDYLM